MEGAKAERLAEVQSINGNLAGTVKSADGVSARTLKHIEKQGELQLGAALVSKLFLGAKLLDQVFDTR